jgi:hypothetical protein
MADIALEYATECGFSVIPIKRDKTPYVDWKEFQSRQATEQEIRHWFRQWPSANIAVVTGEISQFVVVDIDGDCDRGFDLLRSVGIGLPPTRMVQTGRGGVHLWFAYPGVSTASRASLLKDGDLHIDVRGDGGYALVPPSLHENGKQYHFVEPFKGPLPVLPAAFMRLLEDSRAGWPCQRTRNPAQNTAVDGLAEADIVEVIQSHGWSEERPVIGIEVCVLSSGDGPSLVITPSKGLFHCWLRRRR